MDKTLYDGKVYVKREHHKYTNGVHRITNSAYQEGTKQEISLAYIPRWAELLKEGAIISSTPMIITYRTPYANNINLSSELPVSFFSNSVNTLKTIDEAHTAYRGEMEKAEAKIFADRTLLGNGGKLNDDYYVNFEADSVSGINNQIMTYSPQVREEQYKAALNSALRLFEIETGLSSGTLTFDTVKGQVTATQILSEDKTTYNAVKQMQKQLGNALLMVAEATFKLAECYGIKVKRSEPIIEFGDSVFEDTGTEFTRRLQMVQAGLLKAELFVSWYFGVNETEALKMLPEMRELFKGD